MICSRCNINKPTEGFCKDKRKKNGLAARCLKCQSEYHKKYNELNKEQISAKRKLYKSANRECINEKARIYYHKTKEERSRVGKQYYLKNKEKINTRHNLYRLNNKKWFSNYQNKYNRLKCKTDPSFNIAYHIRIRMNKALKNSKKPDSVIKSLGCSINQLKLHLEAKFQMGMNWENYGKWHIDHILPLCSFDLTNLYEFHKACHYTNLQPLWAIDNLKKGGKIIK